MREARNVLGGPLEVCGCQPMTGWERDGYCRTDRSDGGNHSVCAIVSESFLEFSRTQGNDLTQPIVGSDFPGLKPGLKPGDRWCLCAQRWYQAYQVGKACAIVLESTHERSLEVVPLNALQEFGLN